MLRPFPNRAVSIARRSFMQDKNFGVNSDGPWQWQYPSIAGALNGPNSSCPGVYGPCVTQASVSKSSNWGTPSDTYNSSGGPGGFRVVQLGAKFIV